MSVLVTVRVSGDVAKFRGLMESDPDRFRKIGEHARTVGAIHHRFGATGDFVLVIDEWETAEQFQTFFQMPEIAAIMAEAGVNGEPEITVVEAISSPDEF